MRQRGLELKQERRRESAVVRSMNGWELEAPNKNRRGYL